MPAGFSSNRLKLLLIDPKADSSDWRASIVAYLCDPSVKVDKNVRRSAFKFILHNGELYRRAAEGLLFKCLDDHQARVAMGKVYENSEDEVVFKNSYMLETLQSKRLPRAINGRYLK